MKKCVMCEENIATEYDETFCKECWDILQIKIGVKCINCGSFGFLPKTEKNIQRFKILLDENFEKLCECHNVTLVPMRNCPECINNSDDEFRIRTELLV